MIFTTAGVSYAAYVNSSKVAGATFSIGTSELKLLKSLGSGTKDSNLTDGLKGPEYKGVNSGWKQTYLVKVFNSSSVPLELNSTSSYQTINDANNLRSVIFVEPFEWDDKNNDGKLDKEELGKSYGKKSVLKWKTEGIDLDKIASGQVKGLVLEFSVEELTSSKQGATGIFDFEFSGVSISDKDT